MSCLLKVIADWNCNMTGDALVRVHDIERVLLIVGCNTGKKMAVVAISISTLGCC